jgi:hypothetical protein
MKTWTASVLAAAVVLVAAASPGRAGLILYTTVLNGPSESPPNNSPGIGQAFVRIDTTRHMMDVMIVNFHDLTAPTTASHIHATTTVPFTGTAGVATTTPTFPGFPLGVTSGSYFSTFDLTLASSYNPAFITANGNSIPAAEAALEAALANGQAYLNIHTTAVPSGEIRGFLVPTAGIPEPASLALWGLGAAGAVAWRVRRRARAQTAA